MRLQRFRSLRSRATASRMKIFAHAVFALTLVLLQAGIVAHATTHVGSPANPDSLLHADDVCALCVAQAGLDQAVPVIAAACPVASVSPLAPPARVGRFLSLHHSPFRPRGPPAIA
jgi:hypothetical protein